MTELTRVELRYGTGTRAAQLPASIRWSGLPEVPPLASPTGTDMALALDHATVGVSLGERLALAKRVGVVVPDRTRPAGMDLVLPSLFDWMRALGADVRVSLIVGGGSHVPDDARDWQARIPASWKDRVTVHVHDARNERGLARIGTTSRGTPVTLCRTLLDVDVVIVTGAIGFHYFAGFSGGRKGIFPGLAGLDGIRANHRHVLSDEHDGLHDACRPGNVAGNPVHEDATEAALCLPTPVFLVNVLASEDGSPEGVVTGDLVAAHDRGCDAYLARHAIGFDEPVDVVVADAGGYPRDLDLVQAHKSLLHAAAAVRDGGSLILLAECADGIGSSTMAPWFDHASTRDMAAAMRATYTLNAHTALSFRRICERLRVRLVTELPDALCRRAGAEPVRDLETALRLVGVDESRGRGLVLPSPSARVFRVGDAVP